MDTFQSQAISSTAAQVSTQTQQSEMQFQRQSSVNPFAYFIFLSFFFVFLNILEVK